MEKVSPANANGCRLYRTTKGNNYGQIWFDGKYISAHVAAYMAYHGPIPDGMSVCHECDVPACVNPKHLFTGTNTENIMDACAKGRKAIKLTIEDVRAIRYLEAPPYLLAQIYGVTSSTICSIKNRRKNGWRWLP